jgi:hypothetical protein
MAATRWVTVHSGPPWQIELLSGLLEEEGIPTFQPDRTTKVVDPFITGANPLSARLQVAAGDAERAAEILQRAHAQRLMEKETSPDEDGEEGEDPEAITPAEEIEYVSTRTRWAALLVVTAPFAVFYGVLYLLATRDLGLKSKRHGLTIAALILSLLVILGSGLAIWAVTQHTSEPERWHFGDPPKPPDLPRPPIHPGLR